MKRILILTTLVLLPFLIHAQERKIVIRGFDVKLGDMRAKTEPVYDRSGKPTALIEIISSSSDSLFIESDNIAERRSSLGKLDIYLSEGTQWIDILVEGCEPCHFEIPDDKPLISAHVYLLDIGIKVLNPMRTLIMPSFSYNKSQLAYGLMLGIGKKNGGYIRAKTDFNFGLNPTYSCNDAGVIDGVQSWFTGESKKSRLAFTAGYLRQIIDPLYIYVGGGWGTRILAWQMYVDENTYEWARVSSNSFSGFEAELGAIFRLGSFALSAGVQTNQFKYVEANVGIGVMF